MSRGHGQTQRAILQVFEATPDELLDPIEIAGQALDKMEITESDASSYRRALRKLAQAGLLMDMGRHYTNGRRRYALPEYAARYNSLLRKAFGRTG